MMKDTQQFVDWLVASNPELYERLYREFQITNSQSRDIPFKEFWDAYDKKVGSKKCSEKWARMSKLHKVVCMQHVPRYVEVTPDPQFRMNPLTYLRGQYYNDEAVITSRQPRQQINTQRAIDAWDRLLGQA
jgi:hypothetical protein